MHLPTTTATTLLILAAPALAHFQLIYPTVRGFDEDTLSQFPCGGQNTPSTNRTLWPLSGGPIQLNMGHTTTTVQALIALGNDPGSAFNTVIVPTLQEHGPQNFCLGAVNVPAMIGGATVTAGMNATIQVVTDGDAGTGGLYNVGLLDYFLSSLPRPHRPRPSPPASAPLQLRY